MTGWCWWWAIGCIIYLVEPSNVQGLSSMTEWFKCVCRRNEEWAAPKIWFRCQGSYLAVKRNLSGLSTMSKWLSIFAALVVVEVCLHTLDLGHCSTVKLKWSQGKRNLQCLVLYRMHLNWAKTYAYVQIDKPKWARVIKACEYTWIPCIHFKEEYSITLL